jgi:gamma-glutamyltranspeptidase/glutathione hydrolase
VAEDIVACLQGLGGAHTLEDFAQAGGEFVTPISTGYKGYDLCECPPNGQGIVALIMMNILSGYDLTKMDPLGAERIHLFLEAAKLAYGDRDRLLADPAMSDVPVEDMVEEMLSEAWAEAHRARIDMGQAGPTPELSMPASPSAAASWPRSRA